MTPLIKLIRGDSLIELKLIPDNSVDSVVTDPPYELGFMGKGWDNSGISYNVDLWQECLRVLKPGGHLLAFGGDRTEHRMKCAIEDAGFEIRTTLAWAFGSGFPKSLNVSKKLTSILPSNLRCSCGRHSSDIKLDSQSDCRNADDLRDGQLPFGQDSDLNASPLQADVHEHSRDCCNKDGHDSGYKHNPGRLQFDPLSNEDCQNLYNLLSTDSLENESKLFDTLVNRLHDELKVVRKTDSRKSDTSHLDGDSVSSLSYSIPPNGVVSRIYHRCQACNKYIAVEGIGTALKPAMELICLARKPLSEKTVAENVLKWGTGGLNIDASRVEYASESDKEAALAGDAFKRKDTSDKGWSRPWMEDSERVAQINRESKERAQAGRWPANLIHDGSEEVRECFPDTKSVKSKTTNERYLSGNDNTKQTGDGKLMYGKISPENTYTDSGNASRFFYSAKESRSERWRYLTCNCETVILSEWVQEDRNQNEKMDSTSQHRDICEATLTDDSSCNIPKSGQMQMALSPQDTICTTKTATSKTTDLTTFNSSVRQNTREYTEDASCEMESGGSPAAYAENYTLSMPGTFICHQKDGRCTGVVVNATSPLWSDKSVCAACGQEVKKVSHPTQKPIDLMRYLCRLVTPPGGTVLDPFMGSGTTGIAARNLERNFIGIELDPDYFEIAQRRINANESKNQPRLI